MTRQTVTAFVAAFVFVGLAVLLVVIPVPFVTWGPGGARDVLGTAGAEPIITVKDIETYPTGGQLDMTIVSTTSADARLSLPQALLSYWLPHRDTLPRESIYAPGKSVQQVESEDAVMMETAQDDAVVAALRADGQPVTEMPAIYSVVIGGPSQRLLLPGDLVVSMDGVATPDRDAVSAELRTHKVGERVRFVVLRQKVRTTVDVVTAASSAQPGNSVLGITLTTGYRYEPTIAYDFGRKIGGPSAGLVFALAIYDKITPGALLGDAHVAGTGTIDPQGQVGGIGGIQEKIAGAEAAGATTFLVPAANCGDLAGVKTSMSLVKVSTLEDAIAAVSRLQTPGAADQQPRC